MLNILDIYIISIIGGLLFTCISYINNYLNK